MLKKVALIIISLSLMQYVFADTIAVRPDHPEKYIVVKGDTLWDITSRFLADPWRWPEVWQWNPHIENPHLIYPGDAVSLSYQDEQPILTVQPKAADLDALPHQDEQPTSSSRLDALSDQDEQPTSLSDPDALTASDAVKLSPRIRVNERPTAVLPLISFDAIKHFLKYPRIVTEDYLDSLPYVLSNFEQRITASTGDKVYVRGLRGDAEKRQFSIYRKGQTYRDLTGKKNRILGYEAVYIGSAVVEKVGDPASVIITSVDREVLAGDRLVAESDGDVNRLFKPALPDHPIAGHIIAIYDGRLQANTYMVIALNIGAKDGLAVGNVLGIYRSGVAIEDPFSTDGNWKSAARVTLPEEQIGTAMVFKAFKQFSYGIILNSTNRIYKLDAVKNL